MGSPSGFSGFHGMNFSIWLLIFIISHHDGTRHSMYEATTFRTTWGLDSRMFLAFSLYTAAAPPTISEISWVIAAWRALL